MKIVFNNIVFSLQNAGGVSNVWIEIINAFTQSNEFDCYFIEHLSDLNNIYWKNFPKANLKIIRSNDSILKSRFISPKIEFDEPFFYFTSGYDICTNKNAKNLIIVHDFINEIFGKLRLGTILNKVIKKFAIYRANVIFCVSQNTKSDLINRYPKIQQQKLIEVIHNGVSDDFFPLNENYTPKDFVLFVGRRSSYKNFDKVIDALENYPKLKLKIVSGVYPNKHELRYLVNKLGKDRFEFLIGISNRELNKLYNNAFCLTYPSDYEGFGIPILEAQKSGCPVICCSNSSLCEISGGKVLFLDNLDRKNFIKAFEKLEDETFRNKLISQGIVNSKNYSWGKMTSRYIQYLNNLKY